MESMSMALKLAAVGIVVVYLAVITWMMWEQQK